MWARVRDLLPTLLAWRAAGEPFVLATVVAARQTADAFPRFVARHGYDVIAYSGQPLPRRTRDDLLASVRADWRETIAAARASEAAPRARKLRMVKVKV